MSFLAEYFLSLTLDLRPCPIPLDTKGDGVVIEVFEAYSSATFLSCDTSFLIFIISIRIFGLVCSFLVDFFFETPALMRDYSHRLSSQFGSLIGVSK
jgi:hypothetical protein